MNGALLDEIRAQIRRSGPMSYARYMQLALYHPDHGYYSRRAPGLAGVFMTAASLTPLFGRLLARLMEKLWQSLGSGGKFTVVEVGAGSGDLAAAVLNHVEGAFAASLEWCIVERHSRVRAWQQRRLRGLPVKWASSLNDLAVEGCIFANEVIDNFPVRVFELENGCAHEIVVDLDHESLVERRSELSLGIPLPPMRDGDRFELREGVERFLRDARRALRRGYLVVIDYGDTEPDIWKRRPEGSLVTYHGEHLGFDALVDPGDRDITCHVNFSELEREAVGVGFKEPLLLTQRELLDTLGKRSIEEELRTSRTLADLEGRSADVLAALAETSRLGVLSARGGLGDLLVLIASLGAPRLEV